MIFNSQYSYENFEKSDIGIINSFKIYEIVKSLGNDNTFVDLGVWHGFSSYVLLSESNLRNNHVYGVDVKFDDIDKSLLDNPNYHTILGDSSTVGKNWKNGDISILFIDTLHAKQQVMTELFFWYDLVKPDGWVIFHDTCWPDDKFDTYWGINWPRPEEAVKEFFNVQSLNYEDENILIETNPNSNGMTFVKLKKKIDYKSRINWRSIFDERNFLTSYFNFSSTPNFLYEIF